MIIAEHLVPIAKQSIVDSIGRGSISNIAHFCLGEEEMDSFPSGAVALLFAESGKNGGYVQGVIRALGALYPAGDTPRVLVLGNLIVSDNTDYTCSSLGEVLGCLARRGVFTILVSSEQVYAQQLLKTSEQHGPLEVAVVSPSLGSIPGHAGAVDALEAVTFKRGDTLSIIGHQGYFASPQFGSQYQHIFQQLVRLGLLRESIHFAEPPIRDARTLLVDFSALRYAEFYAASLVSPNGLYAEELCQLLRYAGYSDSLTSVLLGGFDPQKMSRAEADVMLLAQGIWHLVDGFSNRRNEQPGLTNFASREFFVELGEQEPLTLNFLQSTATGRWWLFIPTSPDSGRWIACDAVDYDRAKHHELPYRWAAFFRIIG